ncbi:MAG: hypothetical protein HXY39_02315 [Chloroflexi bacterium]|nr:hypothetical protein [Chloroflexota bacterium]
MRFFSPGCLTPVQHAFLSGAVAGDIPPAGNLNDRDAGGMGLWAPLDLAPGQVWVNLPQPTPLTKRPYLTALLAALDGATSVADAAQCCAIAEGTAYALLRECCGALKGRRAAAEWRERLEEVLGCR